jgi:hypothetical protein
MSAGLPATAMRGPMLPAMNLWSEHELGRIPPHGTLAEAIHDALARWPALCRFLDDGVSSSTTTRSSAIRPSRSGARITCLPASTTVVTVGP